MVDPFTTTREKLPYGRVVGQWLQQLDGHIANLEKRDAHALLLYDLVTAEPQPEDIPVQGKRAFNTAHCDADVVDFIYHFPSRKFTCLTMVSESVRTREGPLTMA